MGCGKPAFNQYMHTATACEGNLLQYCFWIAWQDSEVHKTCRS